MVEYYKVPRQNTVIPQRVVRQNNTLPQLKRYGQEEVIDEVVEEPVIQESNVIEIDSRKLRPDQVDQKRYDAEMLGKELVDVAEKPTFGSEFYRAVPGGIREAGGELLKNLAAIGRSQALQAITQSEQFGRMAGVDEKILSQLPEFASNETMDKEKRIQEAAIDSFLPIPDPQTVPGNIGKTAIQFVGPYIGAIKAVNAVSQTPLRLRNFITKGKKAKAWKQLGITELVAQVTEQLVFNPDDANAFNLLSQVVEDPAVKETIDNYLAVDPDDNEALNRGKMAVNSAILSVPGLFLARGIEKAAGKVPIPFKDVIKQYKENQAIVPEAEAFKLRQIEAQKELDKKDKELSKRIEKATQPKDLLEETPRVDPDVTKRVNLAYEQLIKKSKLVFDPDQRITTQVADALESGFIKDETIQTVLNNNNITFKQFADTYSENVSQAARELAEQSALKRRISRLSSLFDEAVDPENMMLKKNTLFDERNALKRMDDIRRGLLVSQVATAARNISVSYARQPVEIFKRSLDYGIQKITGQVNKNNPYNSALDILGQTLALLNPAKQMELTREVLKTKPKEFREMMRQVDADVTATGLRSIADQKTFSTRAFDKIDKGVFMLNVFNRAQDQVIRSAIFAESLNRQIKFADPDSSLESIVKSGKAGDISEDIMTRAVDDALKFTFSDSPKGKAGKWLVDTVNSGRPFTTFFIPFPRFLVNSMKFNMEYSPLGFFKSAYERVGKKGNIAEGDYQDITKAITGSALLGSSYLVQENFGGDKWYELNLADGKTADMRSYYPLAPYLYVGDLIKRANNGTLFRLNLKDLAQGLSGVSFRGGTGLYFTDEIFKNIQSGSSDTEKAVNAGKRIAGEYLSGYLVPFQQLRDVASPIDPESQIARSRDAAPFAQPVYSKFPFGTQMAETVGVDTREAQSPTRDMPYVRQSPIFRQLTGVTISPAKNPIEKEINRLDIDWRSYGPGMRDRRLNDLVSYAMGRIMSDPDVMLRMENISNWDVYKNNFTSAEQRYLVTNFLQDVKKEAKTYVKQQFPEAHLYNDYLNKATKVERDVIDEQYPGGLKVLEAKAEEAIKKAYEELEKLTTPQQPAIQ